MHALGGESPVQFRGTSEWMHVGLGLRVGICNPFSYITGSKPEESEQGGSRGQGSSNHHLPCVRKQPHTQLAAQSVPGLSVCLYGEG